MPLNRSWVVFSAVTTTLLFVIAISPYLLHDSLAEWLGSWQKLMFADICHQDLTRTIFVNDIPAAVCGRCLGIYAFLSVGFICVPFFKRFLIKNFRYSKALLLLTFVIMLIDYIIQWLGFYDGSNLTRFATGAALGLSATLFIFFQK